MHSFTVDPIGTVQCGAEGFSLVLEPQYRQALTGLADFSYIQVLYWFDACDTFQSRGKRIEAQPYKNGPAVLGTFATRSPERPNPIALSCAYVTHVDMEAGVIGLAYIDANDGSPVLDIKPYTPSLDRVESPEVPAWCVNWPNNVEQSGEFDWESVFNF